MRTLRSRHFAVVLLGMGVFFGLQACADSASRDPTGPSSTQSTRPPTNGSIAVTVLNELGAGVAGTTVTLRSQSGGASVRETDASGMATFANAPAGSWQADVTPPAGHELDPAFTLPVPVTVTAGEVTNVTLRIRTTP